MAIWPLDSQHLPAVERLQQDFHAKRRVLSVEGDVTAVLAAVRRLACDRANLSKEKCVDDRARGQSMIVRRYKGSACDCRWLVETCQRRLAWGADEEIISVVYRDGQVDHAIRFCEYLGLLTRTLGGSLGSESVVTEELCCFLREECPQVSKILRDNWTKEDLERVLLWKMEVSSWCRVLRVDGRPDLSCADLEYALRAFHVAGLVDGAVRAQFRAKCLDVFARLQPDQAAAAEVTQGLVELASACSASGDASKQRDLLETGLRLVEVSHGPDHGEVAKMLVRLGTALGVLGKVEQQERLLERALRIAEDFYGRNHGEVAAVLNKLGTVVGERDSDRQQQLLELALEIQETYYGPDHLEVAISLTNLGNVVGATGDVEKQKQLLERALRLKETLYDPDHAEIAITKFSWAVCLASSGAPQEAIASMRDVLRVFKKTLGSSNSCSQAAARVLSQWRSRAA